MSEHIEALKQLAYALECFLDSGLESEGSGNADDPHAGMYPNDLDGKSVEPGGEIHNAVCSLQPFYGGKLPAPEARNAWRDLQSACRHESDPYARQNLAHNHAGKLQAWAKGEMKQPEPDWPDNSPEAAHSPDFRSVRWYGAKYAFTPTQAACVNVLWENWTRGTPEVGEMTILGDQRVDSAQTRLSQVFGKGKHPAWGTMIVPGTTRGTFRLAESDR